MGNSDLERIAVLEARLDGVTSNLKRMEKKLSEIEQTLQELVISIEGGKVSGRILLAIATLVGGGIATAVGWFVKGR